jgi:molybdopterin-guanine dinucleotide biosynthesis protein A
VLSAAILTGGGATRFGGCDKGALLVGGRSILAHQLDALTQIADDIMIVGDRLTRTDEVWLRVVPDRVPGCGPLAGLDAALAAARHDTLIVVACDMPFVTARFLRHLSSLAGEADAVVPRTEDGYHPLCAAYTRACQPTVARRLAERRLAVLGLFDDVRTRVVTTEEIEAFGDRSRLLANVNTPAAFAGLEVLVSHQT